MKLTSPVLRDQQPIPAEFAFGVADPQQHVVLGSNTNPPLQWSDLPPETRSLVLICHDPDVPTQADDVNQEGREVPASLPRTDFHHWILVDLPRTRADSGRRILRRHRARRQAGAGWPARHSPGHQQLSGMVCQRPGDGGPLLRLRRPMPALER